MSAVSQQASVTISTLREIKARGEKFACLTAYDASFTRVFEQAGVEVLLVGDSLGMVIQGHDSTLPVTIDEMIYHLQCVSRGRSHALLMADMPFMSDATPEKALHNAARLMKEGGAHMVKIEGGEVMSDTVQQLSARGIPVCVHLGLQPQSIHKLGGYRVQGREEKAAAQLVQDAVLLEEAGADVLLLECVSSALTTRIMRKVRLPVIGIGAGVQCDGQVLVMQDMLGITLGHVPKFARNFMTGNETIQQAVDAYVQAVKQGGFPDSEHSFA